MDDNKRKAARMVFQEQLMQNAMAAPISSTPQSASHAYEQQEATPTQQIRMQKMKIPEQKTSEELQQEKEGMQIRETGALFWRTVVVPPNAYVVHTRRGVLKPVTLGLGQSFRYYPRTDSYLAVPAAMQTIGIVAQGVSKEKQGISILAYVQWLISDFAIAYQRLDFSDPKDPMGIVNAQLREQAEAAIKDKISTMSVDEILTDKAPIIAELTQRMKAVAEGTTQGDRLSVMGGLGLQIVTVQIKEAYVCSQRLWEFLQAPFRNEREREARLSRLRVEEEIRQQELTNRKRIESGEAQTQAEIEKFKAEKESESFEIIVKERMKRQEKQSDEQQRLISLQEQTEIQQRLSQRKLSENELTTKQELALIQLRQEQALSLEKHSLEVHRKLQEKSLFVETKIQELELETRLKEVEYNLQLKEIEGKKILQAKEHDLMKEKKEQIIALEAMERENRLLAEDKEFQSKLAHEEEQNRIRNAQTAKELEQEKERGAIRNTLSQEYLTSQMIGALPELAQSLPQIQEMKTLHINSSDSESAITMLAGYISKLTAVASSLGIKMPGIKQESLEKPPLP